MSIHLAALHRQLVPIRTPVPSNDLDCGPKGSVESRRHLKTSRGSPRSTEKKTL